MTDLATRLLAAIEDKEAKAQAADIGFTIFGFARRNGRQAFFAHLTANDPISVLRRCAADRKLIELHKKAEPPYIWLCDLCRDEGQNIDCTYPCDTIRLLAEGYGITERRASDA